MTPHTARRQTWLDAYGIRRLNLDDAEADDVIAAIVHATPGRPRLIMCPGRDFHQLVADDVQVLNTAMHPGRRHIGPAEVLRRYGVTPAQWPCCRAMGGDRSDDIPGVRGVGPATAARPLSGGLTLEDLPASGRLTGATGRRIRDAFDQILVRRALIRVRSEVAVPHRPTGLLSPALPPPAEVIDKLGLW